MNIYSKEVTLTTKLLTLAAIAAGLAGGVAPAHPESSAEASVEHVSFADLNLQHPAAVAALNARVRSAIRHVCHYESGQKGSTEVTFRDCSKRAWRSAAPQIEGALRRDQQLGVNSVTAQIRIVAR